MSNRRARELLFLVVGVSTPIGILAVNASAFVMQHLAEFRVGIAACALVSGLSFNGLAVWAALNRANRYAPNLYAEYRTTLIAIGVLAALAWSGLGCYWTYLSMQDARTLPNPYAVLTALWLLLLPFAVTFISRRLKKEGGPSHPREASPSSPDRAARP